MFYEKQCGDIRFAITHDQCIFKPSVGHQFLLYEHRRDKLTCGGFQKLFFSACDRNITFIIDACKIACIQPSFTVYDFCCGFFLIVIPSHDICTTSQKFTLWTDLYFHMRENLPTGTYFVIFGCIGSNDRTGFCQTVSLVDLCTDIEIKSVKHI